jgi:hypothetical protein
VGNLVIRHLPRVVDRLPSSTSLSVPVLLGVAIAVLCAWGLAIDDPYFRAVGHGPTAFNYATWSLYVLTAPAALLARWVVFDSAAYEGSFVVQHVLWIVLAALQWRLLTRTAAAVPPSVRQTAVAIAMAVVLAVWDIDAWRTGILMVYAGDMVDAGALNWPVGLLGVAMMPLLWLVVQRAAQRSGRD